MNSSLSITAVMANSTTSTRYNRLSGYKFLAWNRLEGLQSHKRGSLEHNHVICSPIFFGACTMNDDFRVDVAGFSLGRKTDDCQEIDPSLLRFVYMSKALHNVAVPFSVFSNTQFTVDELDKQGLFYRALSLRIVRF
jgi:hypothetical protein